MVTNVGDSSAELRKGDVIEEVNQQPVSSVAEYRKVVSSLDPNGTHAFWFAGGGPVRLSSCGAH